MFYPGPSRCQLRETENLLDVLMPHPILDSLDIVPDARRRGLTAPASPAIVQIRRR